MLTKIVINFLIQGFSKVALLLLMLMIGKNGSASLLGEVSFLLSLLGICGILAIAGMDRYILQKLAYEFVNSDVISVRKLASEYLLVFAITLTLILVFAVCESINSWNYFEDNSSSLLPLVGIVVVRCCVERD